MSKRHADEALTKHHSRRAFFAAAVGGVALAATVSTVLAEGSANMLTVGVGGDHATLLSAMDDIIDNSESNVYFIKLLPGVHTLPSNGLALKPYVSIEGCGQGISQISCSQFSTLTVGTGCKLSHLTLSGHFTSADAARSVLSNAPDQEIILRLENVDIYVTGGYKAAIAITGFLHTCYFDNVAIYTTSIGLQLGGHFYINGLQLFLSGNATHTPYWGIHLTEYARIDLWNSKIGTGYGRTSRPGFDTRLEVRNDALADVIGIYIPSDNIDPVAVEINCYGLNSYARNETTTNRSVRINCVRAESGLVRLYGGLQQAESPANHSVRITLVQSGRGIIEVLGDRYSSAMGNFWGANVSGTSTTTIADNDLELNDDYGGVILCDASAGAYTLRLTGFGPAFNNGMRYIFVKQDASSNTVTISGIATTISGADSVTLISPYQKIEIIATTTEWIIL